MGSKTSTDCVIFFFCMKRSGSYAISNFLFRLFEETKIFYQQKHPEAWLERRKKDIIQGLKTKNNKFILIRYEEHRLRPYIKPLVENWNDIIGQAGKIFHFINMRDPFNMFASRYKTEDLWMKLTPRNKNKLVKKWKCYARAALGIDEIIPGLTLINYNKWLVDVDYRKWLAKLVDRPFNDQCWNEMHPERHRDALRCYSSFDCGNYAEPEKLLTRWKDFKDDPFFRSIFIEDRELWQLSEKIFGHIPGTEYFLE